MIDQKGTNMIQLTGKTAIRHGELNGFVEWLKRHNFNPKVTEGSREDLKALGEGDIVYGPLIAGDKILLVQAPGVDRENPTRFFHIVI
jgi:hypothetical protein